MATGTVDKFFVGTPQLAAGIDDAGHIVIPQITGTGPPQFGHLSGNSSPTLAISFAQAIREVS